MNPILDTRVFEVIFPDGHVAEYATNVIAENMFAMVDDEGYETAIIKSIVTTVVTTVKLFVSKKHG
jgi:hypothetical protein